MTSTASQTLQHAAAGVKAHLLWQVTAKFLSFTIKSIVIRALGPVHFAYVEIQLGLIVSLGLLPCIHAFRKPCLRSETDLSAAALCYVAVIATFLLALVLGFSASYLDPQNWDSYAIVTVALLIRAFAEPPLVFARRRERYQESSQARAFSTLASSLMQTMVVYVISEKYSKPASATGHLWYCLFMGLSMMYAAGSKGVPLLGPKTFLHQLRRDDLVMVSVALGQALMKFVLENGEGIVLRYHCEETIQGAYKLAGNFASFIARFFSEALEEQSFNVFNRLAPAFRSEDSGKSEDMRDTCVDALVMSLKAAILVSILIAMVGPAYSYSILLMLYGSKWADRTDAPSLLNQYFVYLVFMAGNGVSEAFVSAAASTREMKAQTKFTTVLSAAYMLALYYAARNFEASGIIAVNCINMFIRTCYSTWFFGKFTKLSMFTLTKALPHLGVVCTLFAARIISFESETYWIVDMGNDGSWSEMMVKIAMHGISGFVALGLFALSLMLFEVDFVRKLRALRSKERGGKED